MQAARQSKGQFLLLTFKEVFDNITAGEKWDEEPSATEPLQFSPWDRAAI